MTETGISEGWSKVAEAWVGNPEGQHCHWCAYAVFGEGEVHCDNPVSKFHNASRIRSCDGEPCAAECGHFMLSEWYKDDANLPNRREHD